MGTKTVGFLHLGETLPCPRSLFSIMRLFVSNGENPIWNVATGARLRSERRPPTRVSEQILTPATLVGSHFIR